MDATSTSTSAATHSPSEAGFINEMCRKYHLTEAKALEAATINWGSLEGAGKAWEVNCAWMKESEKLMPKEEDMVKIGKKPERGDRVSIFRLDGTHAIRVWGKGLESTHCFSFDFVYVDRPHVYTLTLKDTVIFSLSLSQQIFSIEESLRKSAAREPDNPYMLYDHVDNSTPFDPQWETYIVPEGMTMQVFKSGHPVCTIQIPLHSGIQMATSYEYEIPR